MRQPIIVLDDVSKTFTDSHGGLQVLDGVRLVVGAGEFVSLVGPSGCGKSTLLRIVADLIPPTSGRVTIKGKTPAQARHDRDYGIVFQAPTLYDWRTVRLNVELPLEVMDYPAEKRRRLGDEMIDLVGLTEFRDSYPRQLSGGMQQRVAIARALSFRPSILLMDEPFAALDEITRERLNAELLRIWDQTRVTILFVTHNIADAVFMSDRVAVMSPRPGRITAVASVDLPWPRSDDIRQDPYYVERVAELRALLREG